MSGWNAPAPTAIYFGDGGLLVAPNFEIVDYH